VTAEVDVETPRTHPGGKAGTVFWGFPAVLFILFAALRLFGVTGNRFVIGLIALTPYIAVIGLVLGVIGLMMRRWTFGGIVMAIALITAAAVGPRFVSHEQAKATGTRLVVMSANLYVGQADAVQIVKLVRENNVDVLSLQELSPAMSDDLLRAGINSVLPYRMFQPIRGGAGSGLASKYPLQEEPLADPATFAQPSAIIDLPGLIDPDILVVHVAPGVEEPFTAAWKRELAEMPSADFKLRPRMLVGDFNATLDHPGMRDLLNRGYVDAAERRGAGLVPTWPAGLWPPPVTIDHVLVANRAAVDDYRVVDLFGSDHRAVLAWITLPS
jgi:endonuclease/exonuclease/phosphatase family metal-dependent hydrolase